ncbi:MAG: outer membrane protein assembly factor BamA [Rhodobacteraceae bacterium]|nr:outer membrane protein assembly factor BamA [Paracoccaceae bacterium]
MTEIMRARASFSGRNKVNFKSIIATFIVAFTIAWAAIPKASHAQSYAFSNVQIDGNQRVDPTAIIALAGIARGETVSAAQLNTAYQNIIGSGLFESVEIIPQGSRLIIRVVELPTINRVTFEGNRRIKDENLEQVIQSQSRRVFDAAVAEADAAAISQAYSQQGRLAARVQPKIIRRDDNRVDLVFEIFEGGVIEVERIGFVGNKTYSDRRLRRVLESKQAGLFRAFIRSDTFVEDRIEFDRQVLRDFYQSRGYVDFRITGVNAELAETRDGYFVTFNVEEGQQFRVADVTVTSNLPDADSDEFQKALRMRPGIVYSPSLVEIDIARLERLAVKNGLDFVRVEPRVTRNDRDLTLSVEFVLTRGPRVFVERIDIEGNTTTRDDVIRRQFYVVEGDPFNPREIRQAAERIRALGFFKTADVQAREGSSPQQVIVDVDVEEKPTGSLSFGASYNTDSGLGLTIQFSEQNFLGRGQKLSFGVSTADETRNYSFSFAEPAFLGRNVTFGIGLSYFESERLGADWDTTVGTFEPSLAFDIAPNSRLRLHYLLEYADVTIPATSTVGEIITAESALGGLVNSSIGYKFSYDTRRTGLNPNAGVLLEFGQDFGGLGGDTNFVKTSARAVAQTKILNEEVTLRATLQGGAVNFSSGTGDRVVDRFLIGPSIMRGFEYAGIGPREVNTTTGIDDPLGGNYFAVARFEAEFPVGLPEEYGISAGVFYDIGSVWGLDDAKTVTAPDSEVVSRDFKARQVIGLSIFWDTAIGPLRFNFTEALSKEEFDRDQSFEFTISTQF